MGKVIARLHSQLATGPDGRSNPGAFEFGGDDIREVLLQGLKGGGMPDGDASRLIVTVFDAAPGKGQFAPLALEVAAAWWLGMPEGKMPAPGTDNEA